MTTNDGPAIQVFGRKGSRETRACLRFLKERRMEHVFVDLGKRPMAAGELKRFSTRLGAEALLDIDGAAYRKAGLGYLRMDDGEVIERLLADPALLRLPLVRHGNEVTVGTDEARWTAWFRDQ